MYIYIYIHNMMRWWNVGEMQLRYSFSSQLQDSTYTTGHPWWAGMLAELQRPLDGLFDAEWEGMACSPMHIISTRSIRSWSRSGWSWWPSPPSFSSTAKNWRTPEHSPSPSIHRTHGQGSRVSSAHTVASSRYQGQGHRMGPHTAISNP